MNPRSFNWHRSLTESVIVRPIRQAGSLRPCTPPLPHWLRARTSRKGVCRQMSKCLMCIERHSALAVSLAPRSLIKSFHPGWEAEIIPV